jgi:hypothetical protein
LKPPRTTQKQKTKKELEENEEAGIVGKTWREVKAVAGNRVHWHFFMVAI